MTSRELWLLLCTEGGIILGAWLVVRLTNPDPWRSQLRAARRYQRQWEAIARAGRLHSEIKVIRECEEPVETRRRHPRSDRI